MSEVKKQFGRRLRRLRRYKDVTQEVMAEKAGLTVLSISNIERGVHSPSFENLERIAQSLDVEIKELFDFDD